jgi:uncharacterized protein (DUF305 family)
MSTVSPGGEPGTGDTGLPENLDGSKGVGSSAGDAGHADQPAARSRGMTILLVAAGAVVLLLVGATLGLALSGKFAGSDSATPDNASVDAGFARDMIVHHDQGVLMAHYAEENTTDQEISVMAYDIGYTQTDQIGQMQGWLSLWDLPESGDGTHMGWMAGSDAAHGGMAMGTTPAAGAASSAAPPATGAAATGSASTAARAPLMPGMATSDEIAKLKSLRGAESDTYFLQLMVRHHQGGAPMMQYAAENATNPVVRNFASKMAQAQESEIAVMTQMLAERGAEPLPPNW